MQTVKTAALLAAGLGLRMRPLTENTPKPLLTLGGRTLLDHALDRMAEAGVEQVVVNAHWQADKIEAHLAQRPGAPRTVLRHEAELLDTGGAVAASLRTGLLGPGPFFIANSDSLWLDGPRPMLGRLATALDAAALGVILLHRTFQVRAEVGAGDFFLDRFGVPRRRREQEVAPYIYAGVTLATPEMFSGLGGEQAGDAPFSPARDAPFSPARDAPFSMNEVWDRALSAGRLRAVVHDGLWFHLSYPDDLAEAESALFAQLTGATT